MKKWKQIAIAAGALSILTISAATPLAVLSKKASNENQNNINNNNQLVFKENWKDYAAKATEPKDFVIFNSIENETSANAVIKPYNKLSIDPQETYYQSIFDKINDATVLNDLYWFIAQSILLNTNSTFKLHIDDLKVSTRANVDDPYHIQLSFSLYNPNNFISAYTITTSDKDSVKVNFDAHEIKKNKIIINSKAIASFYESKVDKLYDLYANYYFDNVIWEIDQQQVTIPKFSFYFYSKTIKTKVANISLAKNYLDIAEQANSELAKLTIDDFKNDVKAKIDAEVNKFIPLLDPSQKILQELVKNESISEFLKKSATNISLLIKNISILKGQEPLELSSLVESLLSNQKLFEILSNEKNKDIILDLITKNITDEVTISMISGLINEIPNTEPEFNEWFDNLKTLVANFLPQELLDVLDNLKTQGILTFALNNIQQFLPFIANLIPNGDALVPQIEPLLELIKTNGGLDAKVIDTIVSSIKHHDNTGSIYLLELIKILVQNEKIVSILSSMLFNNDNLTSVNLITSLSEIANPINDSNQVVNYKNWFDSLNKEETFGQTDSFDPVSKQLNLTYERKFTLTESIHIDLRKLLAALPNKIDIPGVTSLDKATLFKIAKKLSFWKGDYFKYSISFDTKVNYDVIPSNNMNVLSWKALAKELFDVNMPQTVKTFYNNCDNLTGSGTVSLFKTIFFHIFEKNNMFRPLSNEKLNKVAIDNYSYTQKTNNAIFTKEITTEIQEQIKTQMNNSLIQEEFGPAISVGNWFAPKFKKTKSVSKFNPMDVINNLVDLSAFENYVEQLKVYINSQIIIGEADFIIQIIPRVVTNSITIELPYNTYSNNGEMKNVWTFSF